MTQPYDNTNSGALFKNDRKEKENQPDYQGTINVEGKDFYLSAWIRQGKSGKFMSLACKPKDQQSQRQAPPARNSYAEQRGQMDAETDIPF